MISIGNIFIILLLILILVIFIMSKMRKQGKLKIGDILWKNYRKGKISKEEYDELKKEFDGKSKDSKEDDNAGK